MESKQMKKEHFKKTRMDCICFCENCGKKLVFVPFYKDVLNNIICKKCYRSLK